MKKIFFIFLFSSVVSKDSSSDSFFGKSGSYISNMIKGFKFGYYSDQITKRRDEIKMRLDFIKIIFKDFVDEKELKIIINYCEKYIFEDQYVDFILNDENFLKVIKKLDNVISERDFSLFFIEK